MKRDPAAPTPRPLLADPRPGHPEAEARDLLADLTLLAEPAAPPPDGLDRLLAALDAPGPFDHLVGAVADLLAVGRAKARALLARVEDPDAWGPGPRPWVELFHLTGAVGVEGAVIGFVRVEAGRGFPHHTHLGEEHVLILQGTCDDGARTLRAGESGRMPVDTGHGLTAGDDAPLIYLAVVFGGIEMDGQALTP